MRMDSKICRKLVCNVNIETISPLRIASGMEDGIIDSLILKNKDNIPFIPATSLAGVLRGELKAIYGEEVVNRLFGSSRDNNMEKGYQSLVLINDITLKGSKMILRDGVKIDEITGTGVKGAKFDFEALDRGAKGNLVLEITLRNYHCGEDKRLQIEYVHPKYEAKGDVYGDIVASIADLLTKGLSLGSLTAKGFGLVQSMEPATVFEFDFSDKKARDAWLKYIQLENDNSEVAKNIQNKINLKPSYVGSAEKILVAKHNQFSVAIDLAIKSALIIRDFNTDKSSNAETKLAAIQLKSKEDYVIPGTSIKGVVRHKAWEILNTLCGFDSPKGKEILDQLMGYSEGDGKSKKSKLHVNEVYIAPQAVQKQVHSRNRIDRFTGGTIEGALFSDEPIWQSDWSKSPIRMELKISNCKDYEAGLLLLIVRDIWLGNLPFGGNKGIGRGVLQGKCCEISYGGQVYKLTGNQGEIVEGDVAKLEALVQALVGECNGK